MSVNQKRFNARTVNYEELPGAVKDADCEAVEVEGGVSKDGGCCQTWERANQDVDKFACGTCKFLENSEPDETQPLLQREANKMSFGDVLRSMRPGKTQ